MKKHFAFLVFALLFVMHALSQQNRKFWWKQNNLRVVQTNLPGYEAASLNPDSLVADLINFSANTLIINAGGIMAFYPSKLPFHYINPHMKPTMLGDVIAKCHTHNIRVIVRFDFSRVHESIFKQHTDWCYISPKGERIINTDMYVVSINAPYVQDCAFKIIDEVMDNYPVDGIFLNMPGYQVSNPYEGKYHGIDQNEYDRKAFYKFSNGLPLPVEENKADTLYQKYLEFKKVTVEDWSRRLYDSVKRRNPQAAICTYTDKYVDIIRHETQAGNVPYWPYGASDNVNNASHSYPNHIISNSSIQQISFQSRYNAVEPEEVSVRLYENIANGSGLDISLMGDMRGYEDERNFETIKKIYAYHKKFEPWFGNYKSIAKVLIVAPGSWPSGLAMQEYRGVQLMLKEAHIPFDIIEDAQLVNRKKAIGQYKLIILPDIMYLGKQSTDLLKQALANGTSLIATNNSFSDDPQTLHDMFGAKIINKDNDGSGNYLRINKGKYFKKLKGQSMISWKFNLGIYDFSAADSVLLPILSKGRPGPPEIIGGHEPTGYYALGVKQFAKSKAILLPVNIGRLYYMQGYKEYKNIVLDVIDNTCSNVLQTVQTNAPDRIEVIVQEYSKNVTNREEKNGLIMHLVNLTGFSGNTYFEPLPVYDTWYKIACDFKPSIIYLLSDKKPLSFKYQNGFVEFSLKRIEAFETIVIDK